MTWYGPEATYQNETLCSMHVDVGGELLNLVPPNTDKDFAQKCILLQLLSPKAAIEADYKLINVKLKGGKAYYNALKNDVEIWNISWAEFRRSILTDDGQDALLASLEQIDGKVADIERFKRFGELMEMTMICFRPDGHRG